ncbi:hypothetical protein SNEBB_004517 [Seison nebaliae]|nr:hypothetical protein SNEBB_004517 [Seison nebaliae]
MSSKRILCLFDMDGTLTPSRQQMNEYMIECLRELRQKHSIAVVSGSDYQKIYEQLGAKAVQLFHYVFSENGLVAHENGSCTHRTSILKHIGEETSQELINHCLGYMSQLTIPVKRGTFVEYRNGLINVCPVGRSCSVEERKQFAEYDKKFKIREKFVENLQEKFSEKKLQFAIGGEISFDIYPDGWDKRYCLQFLEGKFDEIHFFGDKTYKGGNDHEIFEDPRTVGHSVKDPTETFLKLQRMNICLNKLVEDSDKCNTDVIDENIVIQFFERKLNDIVEEYSLKKKFLNNHWTVFAAIIGEDENGRLFLCTLANGTKCLDGMIKRNLLRNQLYDGTYLNDCHAEVLSRRMFRLFLLNEMKTNNSIFLQFDKNLEKYGTKFKFHFITSKIPCGTLYDSIDIDNHRTNFPSHKKPGRPYGNNRDNRTNSLSCCDKIIKWNSNGWEGKRLRAKLIKSIKINNFYFGISSYFDQVKLMEYLPKRFESNSKFFLFSNDLFPFHQQPNLTPSPISFVYSESFHEFYSNGFLHSTTIKTRKQEKFFPKLSGYNFLKEFSKTFRSKRKFSVDSQIEEKLSKSKRRLSICETNTYRDEEN